MMIIVCPACAGSGCAQKIATTAQAESCLYCFGSGQTYISPARTYMPPAPRAFRLGGEGERLQSQKE